MGGVCVVWSGCVFSIFEEDISALRPARSQAQGSGSNNTCTHLLYNQLQLLIELFEL